MYSELHAPKSTQDYQGTTSSSRSLIPAAIADIAVLVRRRRGESIYGSDRPDDYWYQVVEGAARSYVVFPGGRRQILGLMLPGDVFRFTSCGGYHYAVDAIAHSTVVACYSSSDVERLAKSDLTAGQGVRQMILDVIGRQQELVPILGRTTARQKVGAILLKTAERVSGANANRMVLIMSRYDMADYLALSVETISRALTDLKNSGCIALHGPRRVLITDPQRLTDGTENIEDFCVSRKNRLRKELPDVVSCSRLSFG